MKKKKTSKNRKRNFLIDKYIRSWDYLKSSRKFIFAIIGIFFLLFLIGFFISPSESVIQKILEFIQNLLEETEGMSFLELFWFIFFNNLKVSFFGMAGGIFLGIFPVIESIINGYLLGFVAKETVLVDGFLSLWRIFPHGVFELPAVFISLGLGLKLGLVVFKRKGERNLKKVILNSLIVFAFVVIPLLFLAAIIESGLIVFFGS